MLISHRKVNYCSNSGMLLVSLSLSPLLTDASVPQHDTTEEVEGVEDKQNPDSNVVRCPCGCNEVKIVLSMFYYLLDMCDRK